MPCFLDTCKEGWETKCVEFFGGRFSTSGIDSLRCSTGVFIFFLLISIYPEMDWYCTCIVIAIIFPVGPGQQPQVDIRFIGFIFGLSSGLGSGWGSDLIGSSVVSLLVFVIFLNEEVFVFLLHPKDRYLHGLDWAIIRSIKLMMEHSLPST